MKKINVFFILMLTTTFGCHTSATQGEFESKYFLLNQNGVVNGGGGKGVRCDNVVKSLDLYEGEQNGYPKPFSSNDFETDFKRNILKWFRQISEPNENPEDPTAQQEFLKNAMNSLNEVIDIPIGQSLEFTNDATLPPIPNGCSFVQIAVNVIEQDIDQPKVKIFRDKQLWNLMNPIEQSALMMHEYIYSTTRMLKAETNSDETRVIIGKMFSDLETYNLFGPLKNNPSLLECIFLRFDDNQDQGSISKFFAGTEVENGVQGTAMYFYILDRKIFTSRTRTFIPNFSIDSLTGTAPINMQFSAHNILNNKNWNAEINNFDGDLELRVLKNDGEANDRFAKGSCNKAM